MNPGLAAVRVIDLTVELSTLADQRGYHVLDSNKTSMEDRPFHPYVWTATADVMRTIHMYGPVSCSAITKGPRTLISFYASPNGVSSPIVNLFF